MKSEICSESVKKKKKQKKKKHIEQMYAPQREKTFFTLDTVCAVIYHSSVPVPLTDGKGAKLEQRFCHNFSYQKAQ